MFPWENLGPSDRDRHMHYAFLEPIMLCSIKFQCCFHYAHTTIPIMPALYALKKPPSHHLAHAVLSTINV